jgi:hypothetical protein
VGRKAEEVIGQVPDMPKVELNPTLYRRLEEIASKTRTVEMLVNRAVDDYLRNQVGSQAKGPSVVIPPKARL